MKSWFTSSHKQLQEQSGASEVKSEEGISSKSEQHPAPIELAPASNKRARLDAADSPEEASVRSMALLSQLCIAAAQPPPAPARAAAINRLILQLTEGGDSAPVVSRQVQDLMHAAFMSAKADLWYGTERSIPRCAIELPKLVEDALLVQCWLTLGLPAPKPLKSAQVAAIIADVLQELEGCEGPALDFHALADTSSQVVQVVGEADALRPYAPSSQPLLMDVLLAVSESGAGDSMKNTRLAAAHQLGLSKEEASRHAIALALATATRPMACQLLYTIRMFESAIKAAQLEVSAEPAVAEQHEAAEAAAGVDD